MKEYRVLESETAEGLAGLVKKAREEGWLLQGGVSVAMSPERIIDPSRSISSNEQEVITFHYSYAQAVCK